MRIFGRVQRKIRIISGVFRISYLNIRGKAYSVQAKATGSIVNAAGIAMAAAGFQRTNTLGYPLAKGGIADKGGLTLIADSADKNLGSRSSIGVL